MKSYDKSLTEVWDWKESVYQDVKNLTAREYVKKIKHDADEILAENSVKLETIPSEEGHRKIG